MKRTILILLGLVNLAAASPFLVCDPYRIDAHQPKIFTVSGLPGGPRNFPAATNPNGTVQLNLDLGPLALPAGTYQISVVAIDVFGRASRPVTMSFVVP